MSNATWLHKKTRWFLGSMCVFVFFVVSATGVYAETTASSTTVQATVPAICGNGAVEGAETCDDGNRVSHDGCSSTCTTESTTDDSGGGGNGGGSGGSGVTEQPAAVCGNGVVETGELCDDGNTTNGDGCSSTCRPENSACQEQWGDFFNRQQRFDTALAALQAGQPVNQNICTQLPPENCDRYYYDFLSQQRGPGNPLPYLNQTIGGVSRAVRFEQVTSVLTAKRNTSSPYCVALNSTVQQVCGDAMVQQGEMCDDANTVNGDGCSSSCQIENIMCGNGIVELGEECDDGNRVNLDGCSAQCTFDFIPACLNQWAAYNTSVAQLTTRQSQFAQGGGAEGTFCAAALPAQMCDTSLYTNRAFVPVSIGGNCLVGSPCVGSSMTNAEIQTSLNQLRSAGPTCVTLKRDPPPVCGNGVLESGEECDDGNTRSFDSCSPTCRSDNFLTCNQQWARYNGQVTVLQSQLTVFNLFNRGTPGTYCAPAMPGAECDTYLVNYSRQDISILPGGCPAGDGKIDCIYALSPQAYLQYVSALRAVDPYCVTLARSSAVCGNGQREGVEQCDDGNTANGDGCSNSCQLDQMPIIPPVDTLPKPGDLGEMGNGAGQYMQRPQLRFFIARGTLPAILIGGDTLFTLPEDVVTVSIPEEVFQAVKVKELVMHMGKNRSVFSYDSQRGEYKAIFAAPVGTSIAIVDATYDGGAVEHVAFEVKAPPLAEIVDADTGELLNSVQVSLIENTGSLWNAQPFEQQNPATFDSSFGFLVPNGRYTLTAKKDGYITRKTFTINVTNHVVGQRLDLIAEPSVLKDLIDPDKTIQENIASAATVIGKQVSTKIKQIGQLGGDAGKKIEETRQSPVVQQANKKVVAPTTVGVAVATVVPSLVDVAVPLFRYVFLQPILFVGRKKRQKWGQIYNSLTRLPIDLAMVRLVDKKTNRVLQSRVTDLQGRYVFIVEPGDYRIEVTKQGFQFPSTLLKGVMSDGKMLDIYHGETVTSDVEGAIITPNIPLDPVGAEKKPARILFEQWLRGTQHVISVAGIILTAVSLYVSPSFYIAGFLVVHTLLYGLFLRHVKPPSPKGWGIVADESTKQPVGRVLARLFTKEYNKLVSAQVTDAKGRYAFLVGPNQYYVTFEKTGYLPAKIEQNIPDEAEKEFINADVSLKSGTSKIV